MEKITLYYFLVGDKSTRARGENVKLLLVDAGLDHEYVRIQGAKDNWPALKAQLSEEGYYGSTLPYIKMDGKVFGRTIPIMRYISAKLDHKYHGSNEEENFHVDHIADITNDWFDNLKNAYFGDDEKKKHHFEVQRPRWFSVFDKYYGDNTEGPYILGNKITYADFLVYHILEDENALDSLSDYPNLIALTTAFEERPNIKEYFKTRQ